MRGFMKCRAESLNDWTVHAVDIPTASHLNAVTPIMYVITHTTKTERSQRS